jgi:hypothetical protein
MVELHLHFSMRLNDIKLSKIFSFTYVKIISSLEIMISSLKIRSNRSLTDFKIYAAIVYKFRALSKIFGPKRDEVTGEWRKLRNEELRDLYSSPSIIRIIKLKRMRWAGHVARMGRRGTRIDYWWESQRERDH